MANFIPLQGYRLSGKVGNLVFCTRGNRTYVRARVKPRDPKSDAQLRRRDVFNQAVAAWNALSDDAKEQYRRRAEYAGRTGYNLFVGEFLANN